MIERSKSALSILGFVLLMLFLIGCELQEDYETSQDSVENIESNSLLENEASENLAEGVEEEQEIEEEPEAEEIIVEQPTCTDECSQPICSGLYYIDCLTEDNGCKEKQTREKIKGKCEVECLEDSDCSSDETCSSNKCEEKSDFLKALEEAQEELENYQERTDKLDECTRVCAGEDYDIPVVKDQWYLVCYQLYYNLGMDALDDQIAECQ